MAMLVKASDSGSAYNRRESRGDRCPADPCAYGFARDLTHLRPFNQRGHALFELVPGPANVLNSLTL
jgi:hypothetical protein